MNLNMNLKNQFIALSIMIFVSIEEIEDSFVAGIVDSDNFSIFVVEGFKISVAFKKLEF